MYIHFYSFVCQTQSGPRRAGEIKSRQTGTLKCSKFFISLELFGLGRPLTTHYEGLIEANRLTFNVLSHYIVLTTLSYLKSAKLTVLSNCIKFNVNRLASIKPS